VGGARHEIEIHSVFVDGVWGWDVDVRGTIPIPIGISMYGGL
jgi:hypothetical protein